MGSWQGARFNMKYVPQKEHDAVPVDTIYGTLVAVERTLACMFENNLDEEGIIHIPKALQDISGIETIAPRK